MRVFLTFATFVAVWLAAGQAEASRVPRASFVPDTFASSASFGDDVVAASVEGLGENGGEREVRLVGAPLCDARGATRLAPPSQTQDVEVSVESGLTLEDCLGGTATARSGRITPRRVPWRFGSSSAFQGLALLRAVVKVLPCRYTRLAAPIAGRFEQRAGVLRSIERPPRA